MNRLLSLCLTIVAGLLLGSLNVAHAEDPKPNNTRPTPPRTTVVKLPSKPFKVLKISLRIKLRDRGSIRSRHKTISAALDRKRRRVIKMKHGLVSLDLTVELVNSQIKMKGTFLASGKSYNISQDSWVLNNKKPKWNMTIAHETPKKDASLNIDIDASIGNYNDGPAGSNYTFNVKNITLHRLLKRLAEFNNLKLSFAPDVTNTKGITLKLKGNTRMGLVHKVCKTYKVTCKKEGTYLLVRKPTSK